MAGFEFRYRLSGGPPTIQDVVSGTATWKKGDMALLGVANTAILGVTGSATFLGVVEADYSGLTAGTSKVQVIVDPDAVYACTDANARNIGASLDIAGASGAQSLASSSNKEFVVVATKAAAADKTLVKFNIGKHLHNVAK